MSIDTPTPEFDIFDTAETREITETASVVIDDYLYLDGQKIKITPSGQIEFTEDLEDEHLPMLLSPNEVYVLIAAGVLPTEPLSNIERITQGKYSKSGFQCANGRHTGWIYIKKDDLNQAIRFGLLNAVYTKEDEEVYIDIQRGNY